MEPVTLRIKLENSGKTLAERDVELIAEFEAFCDEIKAQTMSVSALHRSEDNDLEPILRLKPDAILLRGASSVAAHRAAVSALRGYSVLLAIPLSGHELVAAAEDGGLDNLRSAMNGNSTFDAIMASSVVRIETTHPTTPDRKGKTT